MIKRVASLLLLLCFVLFGCTNNESGFGRLTPAAKTRIADDFQTKPPVSNFDDPTSSQAITADIDIKTDRSLYKAGESMVVSIENNSDSQIQYRENCSLNLCFDSGMDWICEERECDGPVISIDPGSHLKNMLEVKALIQSAGEGSYQYKLDYQIETDGPLFFAYSNEFIVQSAEVNCERAKEIALNYAKSNFNTINLDPTRAFVRWQDEDQTCLVDIAMEGAEQIREGLWTEGYAVIVSASSGQVKEANAYER